jgi:hypothetical protein
MSAVYVVFLYLPFLLRDSPNRAWDALLLWFLGPTQLDRHKLTHTGAVGTPKQVIGLSQRPLLTQHTANTTDEYLCHAFSGIRTRNPRITIQSLSAGRVWSCSKWRHCHRLPPPRDVARKPAETAGIMSKGRVSNFGPNTDGINWIISWISSVPL